ncbi:MAG: Rieske (2Fe-2S) protein, partial [Alphaproteobacteria bacterium]
MTAEPEWIKAIDRDALRAAGGAKVVKPGGRQILLLETEEGLFAINNRCPHEGYPLSEGTLGCGVLTCNWHNWKFDLKTGRALDGGDPVRTWPLEERGGEIWIDVSDPPAEERRARALANFAAAFEDYDYTRLARELARLEKAGGRAEDALGEAVRHHFDRFEYGMTHAFAAAPDWL